MSEEWEGHEQQPQQQEEAEIADDQTVSMVDVLNDEQQLQDDAAAVLGACDDSVCTYSQVLTLLYCLASLKGRYIPRHC